MTPRNNIQDKGPAVFYHPVAGAVADLDFLTAATFVNAGVSHTREVYVGVQGNLKVTRPDGTVVTIPNAVGRISIVCTGAVASGSTASDVTYLF